jgi:hypothetical protein
LSGDELPSVAGNQEGQEYAIFVATSLQIQIDRGDLERLGVAEGLSDLVKVSVAQTLSAGQQNRVLFIDDPGRAVLGEYDRELDLITLYVRNPGTIVHESAHRDEHLRGVSLEGKISIDGVASFSDIPEDQEWILRPFLTLALELDHYKVAYVSGTLLQYNIEREAIGDISSEEGARELAELDTRYQKLLSTENVNAAAWEKARVLVTVMSGLLNAEGSMTQAQTNRFESEMKKAILNGRPIGDYQLPPMHRTKNAIEEY